jgi:hypothetical protein
MLKGTFPRLLVFTTFAAGLLHAQAGSIVGTVLDSSGSVIPNVAVKAVLSTTGAERGAIANEHGDFVFSAMPPGIYTLTVEHPGFRKYERKEIVLPPAERLSVGQIQLEVGTLTETVSVVAQGATVQTASTERSGLVSTKQMESLTVLSRDFTVLLTILPGVVTNARGETPGFGGSATFNVQGLRTNTNDVKIDGLPGQDLGNANDVTAFISMDTVAEVKIMMSNYQAEFGRKPGASIQAVTKSGTREFHGNAYWYKRHEQFNANNFFNNRQGIAEPKYRYTTAGYNLGGPLYIPKVFNRDRNKLFFFFSQEILREARPQAIRQLTMPTALERAGNFSDTRDLNGALIVIRDPQTNAPFAGNIVPANRINPQMQRYLNLLPEPNFNDISISARRYNYQVQESLIAPKHTETIRVDYNARQDTSLYFRFTNFWEDIRGWAVPGGNGNWGWLPNTYKDTSRTAVFSGNHIFNPSLILEFSAGVLRATENGPAQRQEDIDRLNRANSGVTIPQFFPENNPLGLVPRASFGGITNAPSITYENRFPLRGTDTMFTWNGTLTKVFSQHTVKAGFWAERARNFEEQDGIFAGDFNFGRDVNNPNDSNYAYANALLGNFASYTESTTRPWEQGRSTLVEWFVQDNWKVTRRLTLDVGLRFGWVQPYHSFRREEAGFVLDRWNPAQAVRLIEPVRVGSARVGRHPLTGEIYPAAAIGAIAPGVGDPFNGTVNLVNDREYPQGLRENSGLKAAPRFGFAWDLFGNSKTAVRGGWGLFYNVREQGSRGWGTWRNPPMRAEPVIYYGNVATFINSSGVMFPAATTGHQRDWPVAKVMNFSLGVQQNVGFGTVAEVSYVGSLGRHLPHGRNLNAIPFGANFDPRNEDPTNPGRPLPAAFLRPFPGYNDIIVYEYASNSSYHSLQVTANRRFSRGIQFGSAWTWSKAMDYVDGDTNTVSALISPKIWNYGRAGYDRTHIFTVYWIWDLPRGSRLWNNAVTRHALDDWQLSGIFKAQSGAPMGIGLGFVNSIDITGSPTDGARVNVVEDPVLPKNERTFSRNFNTNAFRPPVVGSVGNAPKDVFRGPGVNNWDISFFKNFRMGIERVRLQFRSELYNAFNHTQFTALDTATRFDAQGNQVNARFGEFTSAAAARRIQLALRLSF